MHAVQELEYIKIVLVQPTHPGNIGATARAMANMGIARLALVQPRDPDIAVNAQAVARAAGAEHILQNAQVVAELDQAIAECALVIGSSARVRRIAWPMWSPREAMQRAVQIARGEDEGNGGGAKPAQVALLFGRESRGLSNDDLERCHALVRIPVSEEFPSLNIAAAAMVLFYELRTAALQVNPEANVLPTKKKNTQKKAEVEKQASGNYDHDDPDARAQAAEMQHFYQHLHRLLATLRFGKGDSTKLHRKLTRLFNRAHPYAQEIRMLRGLFTAIEQKLRP